MENKILFCLTVLANGWTFSLVCLIDLYLALCYLISFYSIFFIPPIDSYSLLYGRQHHRLYLFNIPKVLIKLENAAKTLLQYFKDNTLKANPDKCHLSISNKKVSK